MVREESSSGCEAYETNKCTCFIGAHTPSLRSLAFRCVICIACTKRIALLLKTNWALYNCSATLKQEQESNTKEITRLLCEAH
eukprot:8413-Heterococcus_DN1.PRE.2